MLNYSFCPVCGSKLVTKILDSEERLACSSKCDYVFWNNPIPVVAIVVETDRGILLAHNRSWPDGVFSVITGFLEANESPESAAIRETKEELGLDATSVSFIGNFIFERLNQLMIAFHIHASGSVVLNDELDDIRFVNRSDLNGYEEANSFDVAKWLRERRVLKE